MRVVLSIVLASVGWLGFLVHERDRIYRFVSIPEPATGVHVTTEDDLGVVRSARVRTPTRIVWCATECPAPGR